MAGRSDPRRSGPAGRRSVQRGVAFSTRALLAAVAVTVLGACSVGVPDPAARETAPASRPPAAPTVTPGHDAGAVAARSMPFSAGSTLARGVPVQVSEGLAEAPGWRRTGTPAGGASEYRKSDGCLAAAKVRTNQWPLVAGNDRESTERLFAYLDPTILPKYLKPDVLRWGGEAGKPGPTVDVLVFERAALPKGRAAMLARVFGQAGSSVFVTLACPSAPALAAARGDVGRWLAVEPPAE